MYNGYTGQSDMVEDEDFHRPRLCFTMVDDDAVRDAMIAITPLLCYAE